MAFPSRVAVEGDAIDITLYLGGPYPDITDLQRTGAPTSLEFTASRDGTPNVAYYSDFADGDTGQQNRYFHALAVERETSTYVKLDWFPIPTTNAEQYVVSDDKMWINSVGFGGTNLELQIQGVLDLADRAGGIDSYTIPDVVVEDQIFELGIGFLSGNAGGGNTRSPNSTAAAPKLIEFRGTWSNSTAHINFYAIEIAADATAEIYQHFQIPLNALFNPFASCTVGTDAYHVGQFVEGLPYSGGYLALTRAKLTAMGGSWDFTNYKAEIDDTAIQAILDTAVFGQTPDFSIIGTQAGFVICYLDGSGNGKAILVSRDWTTWNRINLATSDTTVQAMLDDWTSAGNFSGDVQQPNLTIADDGTYFFTNYPISDPLPTSTVVAWGTSGPAPVAVGSQSHTYAQKRSTAVRVAAFPSPTPAPTPAPTPTPTPAPTPTPTPTPAAGDVFAADVPEVALNYDPELYLEGRSIPGSMGTDVVGAFRIIGNVTHISHDDPIVYPGQAGAAHTHLFWGNSAVDHNTTYESLRTTGLGSTEGNKINRTGKWMPALMTAAGDVLIPDHITEYYKQVPSQTGSYYLNASDAEKARLDAARPWIRDANGTYTGARAQTVAIPRGMRYVAGYALYTVTRDGEQTKFGSAFDQVIAFLRPGDRLTVSILTPAGWDGLRVDSANHHDHIAEVQRDNATGRLWLPETHPYLMPAIEVKPIFTIGQDAGNLTQLYFSSDMMTPGDMMHFDYFEGWQRDIIARWQAASIDGFRNSSGGNLGDGQGLQRPEGWTFNQTPTIVSLTDGKYRFTPTS